MRSHVDPDGIAESVRNGNLVIMEGRGHVIVILSANDDEDKTLNISDPAMRGVERNVSRTDYRLKGTGRIWEVWRTRASE